MHSFLKNLAVFLRFTFADNIRIADQLPSNAAGITGDTDY